ncbi:hypothetical protein [Streptomyces sp. MMBL 11-3]|uniref:hypothetical protein n=1 Tax=Streptomyces sp. MMBL 11-3 TaxID=3382639 RepID=UPI0039B46B00
MSMLAVMVAVLLVLVGLIVVSNLVYVVYQHPTLTGPLSVAIAGAGVLIALVATVVAPAITQ